ncbi:MAG: urate hydroxylase PuuD [Immundisolibacterales bacterium]|nr:urate hydroxylase PuuD [Immundisolibacterales bacterium]
MTVFVFDWLNLLVRWAHLVAGIAWIGTSFYFIALDLSLRRRDGAPAGISGEAWEVHGGGFYRVEKYTVAPPSLPEHLIWFKWEAYLTWMTGFALLVVQFYVDAEAWLIDPGVMALEPWQAIGISFASLAAGWFVYDGLCRSPLGRNAPALAATVYVLVVAAAWGYTEVFSGRSALVHAGALIGTLMAFNVFAVIIPNQKKVTAALLAGETPDLRYGEVGKQRSVHNTYLTLPVLVLMVSGHYPMLTGHPHAWLLVALIIAGGGCARHFLVHHEVGTAFRSIAWTVPVVAVALAAAVWLTFPAERDPGSAGAGGVSDTEVLEITRTHCASCHSQRPTNPAFPVAPKNMVLATTDDLRRYASLIELQTVQNRIMPLGNLTGMTDSERTRLGAWIAAQFK